MKDVYLVNMQYMISLVFNSCYIFPSLCKPFHETNESFTCNEPFGHRKCELLWQENYSSWKMYYLRFN